MSGFFFVPSVPIFQESGVGSSTVSNTVKKLAPTGTDDFSTLLDAYCQSAPLFAVPTPSLVVKSCSVSSESTQSTPLLCPLSAQGTASLGCSATTCSSTVTPQDPLQEFSALLSDALEMVENFRVTLRFGSGNVTVSGVRDSASGVFSFSLEGKKETLVEFFTFLLENLRAWIGNAVGEKLQCPRVGCGRVAPEDGQSEVTTPSGDTMNTITPLPENTTEPEVTPDGTFPLEVAAEPTAWDGTFEGDVLPLESAVAAEASSAPEKVPEKGSPEFSQDFGSTSFVERATAPSLKEETVTRVWATERDASKNNSAPFGEEIVPSFAPAKNTDNALPEEIEVSVTSQKDFAKVFEEVLRMASETKGRKEIVLRLEPEHLGSIIVRLEEKEGKIHCFWEVTNPETRELLVKYLPTLEARFTSQGMPFANFFGNGQGAYKFSHSPWVPSPREEQGDAVAFDDFGVFQVNLLV